MLIQGRRKKLERAFTFWYCCRWFLIKTNDESEHWYKNATPTNSTHTPKCCPYESNYSTNHNSPSKSHFLFIHLLSISTLNSFKNTKQLLSDKLLHTANNFVLFLLLFFKSNQNQLGNEQENLPAKHACKPMDPVATKSFPLFSHCLIQPLESQNCFLNLVFLYNIPVLKQRQKQKEEK